MPPLAILLLLVSAILHTTWNVLLKQANDKFVSTWWAVLVGSIIFLPFLFFTGLPSKQTWILLAISVCVEVVYYVLLSKAYRDADFSLIYPLARGTAPAWIALWSTLILGEKLSWGGWAGLLVIIIGLVIVGSSGIMASKGYIQRRAIFLAFSIAFLISVYSVIDGAAVKQTAAFPYAIVVFFLAPAVTSPLVFHNYGWKYLIQVWTLNRSRLFAIGLLTVLAYLLALVAYSIAPIGYSGAIREVSVVFGALAGWKILGERMGGQRLIGSFIIFIGIVMIAIIG